jgi:hypothetical protein
LRFELVDVGGRFLFLAFLRIGVFLIELLGSRVMERRMLIRE